MLFNSFEFLILVSVAFTLYYLPILRRYQVVIAIVASFVFYAYANWQLLFLLCASIAVNVASSYAAIYGKADRRKFWVTTGVVANLGVLLFFKYSPLFAVSFLPETSSMAEFLVQIPLPIGISFFTFQGISLMVDVYRGKDIEAYRELVHPKLATHALQTTFFISFFPQLVAGPVVKAHDFIPQINSKYFGNINWEFVARKLILGYFLKMVIADNLNVYTADLAYPNFMLHSTFTLLALLFAYSVQIFADFAGYSLIAIGIAGLFGYRLMENFKFPYISTSFSEFWRRWHISLSSFLKEYLYFPLGGNKKGNLRTYINLMLVMFLGGLWHGAAWSYAVWGSFHGIALAIERLVNTHVSIPESKFIKVIQGVWIFSLVTLAWLLFKLPDFSEAILYIQALATNIFKGPVINTGILLPTVFYGLPVVIYHLWYLYGFSLNFQFNRPVFQPVVYAFLFLLIIFNSGDSEAFIYFQF